MWHWYPRRVSSAPACLDDVLRDDPVRPALLGGGDARLSEVSIAVIIVYMCVIYGSIDIIVYVIMSKVLFI